MKTRELATMIVNMAFDRDLAYNDRVNTVDYYLKRYAGELELPPKHQDDCTCMYCSADRLIDSIDELTKELQRRLDQ